MEVHKKVRVIVEHTPACNSAAKYKVYSTILIVPIQTKIGKSIKDQTIDFWNLFDKHQQWSFIGHQLPKEGCLSILAIKEVG